MARKELMVTITAAGRDHGKTFLLREMSALQAEKWAVKAFLALARSGVEVPADLAASGMAGIWAMGLRALVGVTFVDAEPLLDEMFECVAAVPDPAKPAVTYAGALRDGQIEEVATRLRLRQEVFQLHVGFLMGGEAPG